MRGPIFIAGLERSGTSLLYALMASHPNIAMTRRTNLWRYFADRYGDLGEVDNVDACLDKMSRYKRIVKLDVDFGRLREDFLDGERSYARLFGLLEEQVAARAGKPRWGDKSLNIEQYTERLMAGYPGARVLHMIRDPRDRYASVLARWKRRRGDVGAGTAAWLWSARLAIRNQTAYPGQYRIVRYEDLAADPEGSVASICSFIDEPYEPTMLTMRGGGRFHEEGSNSSYGPREVGVIAPDSIGKFRSVLSPRQIAVIQHLAGEPMAALGYRRDGVELRAAERLRLWAVDLPYYYAAGTAWRVRASVLRSRGEHLPESRLVTGAP
jgi:hypothetical protein